MKIALNKSVQLESGLENRMVFLGSQESWPSLAINRKDLLIIRLFLCQRIQDQGDCSDELLDEHSQ